MKKTLGAAAIVLLTLTACGNEEAEPASAPEASPANYEPPEHYSLFDNDLNSVALMYRWVPIDDNATEPMSARYTYDVRQPGDEGSAHDSYMSGIDPGADVKFPAQTTFDFYTDYVAVPDQMRVWTASHLDADSIPEGSGIECMIVSLDGQGILDHNISDDPIEGAICEHEF